MVLMQPHAAACRTETCYSGGDDARLPQRGAKFAHMNVLGHIDGANGITCCCMPHEKRATMMHIDSARLPMRGTKFAHMIVLGHTDGANATTCCCMPHKNVLQCGSGAHWQCQVATEKRQLFRMSARRHTDGANATTCCCIPHKNLLQWGGFGRAKLP